MSFTVIIIIVCVAVAAALVAVFLVFGRSEANLTFDIGGNGPKASGGSDSSAETTTQGRLVGQAAVSGGIIAVLLAKLWSMQLLSSDQYTQQAESNRTRTVSVPAPRGRILDRNGKEIVGNRSSLTVLAEADVADDDIELRLIGNLIGMPALAVKRKVQDSSAGAQSLRSVAVDVSRRVVAFLGEHPELHSYAAVVSSDAERISDIVFDAPCVAVIGNEGNGLGRETIDACGHRITIPMKGNAESLNASAAATIIIWEMLR